MSTIARTNLILDRWHLEALRSLAAREGKSVSALVREILTRHLEPKGRKGRRTSDLDEIAGIVHDRRMSGRHHDEVLYGAPRKKRRR